MYALLKREVKKTSNHICLSDHYLPDNNDGWSTFILVDLYHNLKVIKKYLKCLVPMAKGMFFAFRIPYVSCFKPY